MSTSTFTCSVCEEDFKERYFDKEQKKCILHCEKNQAYEWYTEEKNKRQWNTDKLQSFWKCIKQELRSLSANPFDDSKLKEPYYYSNVVFPKFEDDIPYCSYANNEWEQATNFQFLANEENGDPSMISMVFSKLEINFIECTFLDTANFARYHWEKPIAFENCKFTNGILLPKKYLESLSFFECNFYNSDIDLGYSHFDKNFVLDDCKNINNLDLEESTFEKKVKIQLSVITGESNFYNTKFKDLADFYRTEFNEVIFTRTDFNKISIFSETEFNKDVDFKYTKFLEQSIFRDTVFIGNLNLRNTIFEKPATFLDITSVKNPIRDKYIENKEATRVVKDIQVKNRETARIIKKSLDSTGNIIEANKFYALEMKERAKELKFNKKPLEWFVFKLHGLSSNHSQSWLLALLWLILLSIISVNGFNIILNEDLLVLSITFPFIIFLSIYIKYFILETILLYFIGIFFFYSNVTLINLANALNPISKLTGNDITMGVIIYKAITAYLIYQFVISVRQNTRRK